MGILAGVFFLYFCFAAVWSNGLWSEWKMSNTDFSWLQPNFKDYPVYLAKFKQCLSKAMHFMKIHIVNTMQNLTSQLTKRVSTSRTPSCFPQKSTVAQFPSPCFREHFGVSHVKRVMEMPKIRWKLMWFSKSFYSRVEEFFDSLRKGINAQIWRWKHICLEMLWPIL